MAESVHFPGAWQNLPIEVRRYLTQRALDKQLLIQDGSAGLIEWLYRGDQREEFKGHPAAHRSGIIRFNASAKDIYDLVLADTKRWLIEREKKEPHHSGRPI